MTPYIVFGGPSSENEVSQKSKDLISELLVKHVPVLVEWQHDLNFLVSGQEKAIDLDTFLAYLKSHNGIFVNAMHGEFCEDGWIQEKLEIAHIPFTGPSSKAAKNTMDKIYSQEQVKDLVKTIPTVSFQPNEKDLLAKILTNIATFPIFIKPNAKGSSVGIFLVHNLDELTRTLANLTQETYLAQPAITGMELSVGAVYDTDHFLDLPPTEIIPKSEFFDYTAKYSTNASEEITPARIPESVHTKLKELTNKIHSLFELGCYSRSDYILTPENEIVFIETNSLPGMTSTSLLPQQLRHIGLLEDFGEILLRNAHKSI